MAEESRGALPAAKLGKPLPATPAGVIMRHSHTHAHTRARVHACCGRAGFAFGTVAKHLVTCGWARGAVELAQEVVQRPGSGQLLLYHRGAVRHFRRDAHGLHAT